MEKGQAVLKGKISFKAILRLESGLHIGAASDFAPIGAVDSPFIRDPYTKLPIIPGSSLKGKLRTLLAKSYADGYILNDINQDKPVIQRLFGASNAHEARASRLQFFDLSVTEESIQRFQELDMDTYMERSSLRMVLRVRRQWQIHGRSSVSRRVWSLRFGWSIMWSSRMKQTRT